MIVEMRKLYLAAPLSQRDELLQWLQDEEIVHVTPLLRDQSDTEAYVTDERTIDLQLSHVQFCLEFISRIRHELGIEQKRNLRDLFASKPVATLPALEEALHSLSVETLFSEMRDASDTLTELVARRHELIEAYRHHEPWQNLEITGAQLQGTEHTYHALVTIPLQEEERMRTVFASIPTLVFSEVHRVSDKKQGTIYGEVALHRTDLPTFQARILESSAEIVTLTLSDTETLAQWLQNTRQQQAKNDRVYHETLERARSFLELERSLRFAYDALLHRKERVIAEQQAVHFSHAFVLLGWVPLQSFAHFTERLEHAFPAAAVSEAPRAEGEQPPVALRNSRFVAPFEAVTDIFGRPRYDELDPSGPLSLFFLIGFGLALTDGGYGIVLMLATFLAERFFRLKRGMQKMVRLLFYAGISTTILGALTGSWFSIDLTLLPAGSIRDALLGIKLIDPVNEPLKLLGVAFAVGIVQLLFAWIVKGYDSWQKRQYGSALVDSGAWVVLVILILAWVGTLQGLLPNSLAQPVLWAIYGTAGVLVVTQGRHYKNLFVRLGAGLLSLYGLVTFLSDMLSYSRLLALGLATAIIGTVVNLLGGMVAGSIPVLGFVLAGAVLLVGHTFNLGINALGAFIHSGRLQFVEFFPKFLEGGGAAYKPLGRVGRYVDNPREFV